MKSRIISNESSNDYTANMGENQTSLTPFFTDSTTIVTGMAILRMIQKIQYSNKNGKHGIYKPIPNSGCSVILMSSPPQKEMLNTLPITTNSAYIRVDDTIFYINKELNECAEIYLKNDEPKKEFIK